MGDISQKVQNKINLNFPTSAKNHPFIEQLYSYYFYVPLTSENYDINHFQWISNFTVKIKMYAKKTGILEYLVNHSNWRVQNCGNLFSFDTKLIPQLCFKNTTRTNFTYFSLDLSLKKKLHNFFSLLPEGMTMFVVCELKIQVTVQDFPS